MLNLIIHNQSEEQKQAVEGIMKSKERVFKRQKQEKNVTLTVRDGLTRKNGQMMRS